MFPSPLPNRVLSAGVRNIEPGQLAGEAGMRLASRLTVVPRHPLRGLAGEPICVSMQDGQIVEWIGVRKLTRVDQTHEQIADASTTLGFIEQRIPAMQDRFFQSTLNNGAVERSAWHA